MTLSSAGLDLAGWLVRALQAGGTVRERYKLSTQAWNATIRPDCNAETVHAFLCAWRVTRDAAWLTRSRAVWDGFSALQNADGSWPFTSGNALKAINDNAEVAVYLIRASEVEPDSARAGTYRTAALATVDWILAMQWADGGWYGANYTEYVKAGMWAGQCAAALTIAYPYASPAMQSAIVDAVALAAQFIAGEVRPGGWIKTCFEYNQIDEAWRPPSSDTAICVWALALAELRFPAHADVSAWRATRATLHGWLDPLIHASGALRNGYGAGITNADVAHITDNVYCTKFAAEAYRAAAAADASSAYAAVADGILAFAAGNVYYGADPDANGCLRGAYDLTAQNWDTSEVPQNGGEEGGGDMAYSGWSAAPVAALLLPVGRRRPGMAVL